MIPANSPIGIFDSGVGGLSVVRAVQQLMPSENIIYLADSLYVPYGERSEEWIENRALNIAEILAKHQVKAIVVACNTATAAAANALRVKYDFPIIGLEPALKPAVENTQNSRVGVLATQSTLDSQKYQQLKKRFAKEPVILERASSFFVELVENAPILEQKEVELIEVELKPFIEANVDSLVLGCTHYPFLAKTIKKIMGPEVTLFDSGFPVAKELMRRLRNNLNGSTMPGSIEYFSSHPAKAQSAFDYLLDGKTPLAMF